MIYQDLMQHQIIFNGYILITAIFSGCVAAISGFGIGSLLTPLLSLKFGTKLAISAVAIPHFVGTFIRFWVLKAKIDKKILIHFGISSALGGLVGALLFWKIKSPVLTIFFGLILIFAGFMELSNIAKRVKFGKVTALIGGGISGFLGGLIGNQGGIRSAALLSFDIDAKTFVATSTAIGLIVDVVRTPIYFFIQTKEIINIWGDILIAIIGVVIGTIIGLKILNKIPKDIFRIIVAVLLLMLGLFMTYKGINI